MCDWKPDFDALNERVTNLENQMGEVKDVQAQMRKETNEGFKAGAEAMSEISKSVSNLAHDFGERMNNIDKRMVAEKEKWGECLRSIVTWAVRVLLAGAAVAMGITAWQQLIK